MKVAVEKGKLICVSLLLLLGLGLVGNLVPQVKAAAPTSYALDFTDEWDSTPPHNYMEVPDHSSLNFSTGDFTISTWFKTPDISSPQNPLAFDIPQLLGKHTVAWGEWWYLDFYTSGELEFTISNGTIDDRINTLGNYNTLINATWDDSEWHCVVITRDVPYLNMTIDGTLYASKSTASAISGDSASNLQIGGDIIDNAWWSNATMDDIQIYSRAITESEMTYLYNSGNGRFEPQDKTDLELWLKFDESSGTVAYDRSVNKNHGTIHGATWATGITPDWFSVDQFYIQPDYNTTLTSPTYSNSKLTCTVSASSGITSATKVYVGDKGAPISVTGATSYSYNAVTNILTITVLHSSDAAIEVNWNTVSYQLNQAVIAVASVFSLVLIVSMIYLIANTNENWKKRFYIVLAALMLMIITLVIASLSILGG